jgi:hypothetical protein
MNVEPMKNAARYHALPESLRAQLALVEPS